MTDPYHPADAAGLPVHPSTPMPDAQYPQTADPQPTYPPFSQPVDEQQPPHKSRTGQWITLAIVSALLVAGCGVGAFALVSTAKRSTKLAASPTASAKITLDPTRAGVSGTVHLTLPTALNGHRRNTDSSLAGFGTFLGAEMKRTLPEATQRIGGVYGAVSSKTLELVIAYADPITDPAAALNDAVTGFDPSLGFSSMGRVSAGPLGGIAECGDGDPGGIPVALCGWADNGSSGIVAFFFQRAADVQTMFLIARGDVEILS